eukprot:gene4641-5837_t
MSHDKGVRRSSPPNAETRYSEISGGMRAVLASLQIVLSLSTMTCLGLLAQFYYLSLANKRREWEGSGASGPPPVTRLTPAPQRRAVQTRLNQGYSLLASGSMRSRLFFEFAVHVLHPVIFLREWADSAFAGQMHEFSKLWMFLRLYTIARVLHTHSQ